jgi:hypothetical protein
MSSRAGALAPTGCRRRPSRLDPVAAHAQRQVVAGVGAERDGGRRRRTYDRRMSLLPPTCHCCLTPAPHDRPPEHTGWYVLTSRDGELLGLACVGCVADEELLVVELEGALVPA